MGWLVPDGRTPPHQGLGALSQEEGWFVSSAPGLKPWAVSWESGCSG